jgi:hypothetical protein
VRSRDQQVRSHIIGSPHSPRVLYLRKSLEPRVRIPLPVPNLASHSTCTYIRAVPDPGRKIVGIPVSRLQAHIDHWYSLLSSRSVKPTVLFGANTGVLYQVTQFYRLRSHNDRFGYLLTEMLDIYSVRLGPTSQPSLEIRLEMCAGLLEESRWDEAIQAIQAVQRPSLTIRWIQTLTLKENNAFILSSFAWHIPGACCAAGRLEPALKLLRDLESLRENQEVVRVRPYVVFACLWTKTQIAPLQGKDEQESAPPSSELIEAAAELLINLNNSTL